MFLISEDNEAMNGEQTITVTAMDAAGNSAMATAMVTLLNEISYTSTIPVGISLFHVPLDVEGLDTVGDLETMIGDTVNLLITYDGTTWNSRSSAMAITADLGILVSLSAETTVTFTGNAWGAGDSMINLSAGSNLVGVPVNDDRVTTSATSSVCSTKALYQASSSHLAVSSSWSQPLAMQPTVLLRVMQHIS